MPDFDTRKPQEPNEPDRFRVQMVANKLRTALMATSLRALLIVGGILLFVVAVPVGLLIYSPSWLGAQDQGSSQQTSDEPMDMASVGRCTDKGSTVGQQEGVGSVLETLAGLLTEAGVGGNGKIAFSQSNADGYTDIYVIDEEGAHETRLTHTTRSFEDSPIWSPDGQKIAFTTPGEEKSALYVMNADGTNKTQLAGDVWSYPSWSPDGQKIAFTTQGQSDLSVINVDGSHKVSLITASFAGDSENPTVLGSTVWSPTGNKIAFASNTFEEGYASSSASASAANFTEKGLTGIYLINVDGTGLCKLTNTQELTDPVWSPDGGKIAFSDEGAINVINTDGSGREALAIGTSATWSPDGQKIAFVDSSGSINAMNADGSGQEELDGGFSSVLPQHAWSPDGQKIAFFCSGNDMGADHLYLCVINADGTERTRLAREGAPGGYQPFASWGSG
jgi:Tol biopolymer transport system component